MRRSVQLRKLLGFRRRHVQRNKRMEESTTIVANVAIIDPCSVITSLSKLRWKANSLTCTIKQTAQELLKFNNASR